MRTQTHSNFERKKKLGLFATLAAVLGLGKTALKDAYSLRQPGHKAAAHFVSDARAFINLGTITGILTTVIVGIVVLLIIAALAPTYITAIADLVNAIENTTFNNTTADSLRSVFGLLIALGGLFAIVGFAFLAYRRRRGGM